MKFKITKEYCEENKLTRKDAIKIILKEENYTVFKIFADYKKQEPHPFYFMIGKNKNKIKKIFSEIYTWLNVYSIEEFEYNKDDDEIINYLSERIIL